MKLELHVHTRYSRDSFLCFWPLYLKCRICGIDGIAITEHNNIQGGLEFQRFCRKHGNRIRVIVGEEIFTSEGEIIGLFLSEEIPAGMTPEETISEIRKQGGIVYVPHPFDKKRAKTVLKERAIADNREQIDCIEIHNGRNISVAYDREQAEIAHRYSLCQVIGSDAHTWIEIGRNYIEIDTLPESAEEFKKFVRQAGFNKKKCIQAAHEITKGVKAVRIMSSGGIGELYRIIVKRIKKSQSSCSQED